VLPKSRAYLYKNSKNADKCKHVIAKRKIMEICKLSGSMLYGN
jgi:hypothetical protein